MNEFQENLFKKWFNSITEISSIFPYQSKKQKKKKRIFGVSGKEI